MIERVDELDKDYLTRWIEAEYEVLGWFPPLKPLDDSLIEVEEEK